MPTKADYVRAQPREPGETHTCHAQGCNRAVKPAMFMCFKHWQMVPPAMQAAIWRTFRPGQEKDKQPSEAYVRAAERAIRAVREYEDANVRADARSDLRKGGLL